MADGQAGDVKVVVLSEDVVQGMPRVLELRAALSDGRYVTCSWDDTYAMTTLSIAQDLESEAAPCVDSETGLSERDIRRIREEVTDIAEQWRHENSDEYDDGRSDESEPPSCLAVELAAERA